MGYGLCSRCYKTMRRNDPNAPMQKGNCLYCGKEFNVSYKGKKYCSRICGIKDNMRDYSKMYSEYLKGKSINEVAKMFRITHQAVSVAFKRRGFKTRNKKQSS